MPAFSSHELFVLLVFLLFLQLEIFPFLALLLCLADDEFLSLLEDPQLLLFTDLNSGLFQTPAHQHLDHWLGFVIKVK